MNHALAYLAWSLLKRQVLHFCRGLRRPTTLIGCVAVVLLLGSMFYYRRLEIFAQLVRPASLVGGALVMLGGSLFKGVQQRGLAFEPADVEFLFTSPFTQRQLVLFRLLPNYLFALAQGLVFGCLFSPHLANPVLVSSCLILFQAACFHVATGAAIFAGTLSETAHHRLRWMMLGTYGLVSALYLRWAWDLRLVPAMAGWPVARWLFYPGLSLSDVASAPYARIWTLHFLETMGHSARQLWTPFWYIAAFGAGALSSLWLLLKFKADIFEASLATTARLAERRMRRRQGGRHGALTRRAPSLRLPSPPWFRGVGAIVWKNLVVARRCRHELLLALVFTLLFSGFLAALLWIFHRFMTESGGNASRELADFQQGVALMLSALAFLLQWTFSFDFRRDGRHLLNFRTLPVSSLAIAFAEIAVTTILCLGFQCLGILVLWPFTRLDATTLLFMLLGFPAIALALNGIWNLQYLLTAARRAAGRAQSSTAVGTLMVVALSFLIFYPAVRTGLAIGDHPGGHEQIRIGIAIGTGLAVQYLVDFLLLLILAKLFERVDVARDSL